jgi:hypothetical protein
MSYCIKCHRPLRLPSPDGLGPVCRRKVALSVDLFTPRIEADEAAARVAVRRVIEAAAVRALLALSAAFAAARRRVIP